MQALCRNRPAIKVFRVAIDQSFLSFRLNIQCLGCRNSTMKKKKLTSRSFVKSLLVNLRNTEPIGNRKVWGTGNQDLS